MPIITAFKWAVATVAYGAIASVIGWALAMLMFG